MVVFSSHNFDNERTCDHQQTPSPPPLSRRQEPPPSAKMNYLYLWEINKVLPVVKNTVAASAGPDAVVIDAHGKLVPYASQTPTYPLILSHSCLISRCCCCCCFSQMSHVVGLRVAFLSFDSHLEGIFDFRLRRSLFHDASRWLDLCATVPSDRFVVDEGKLSLVVSKVNSFIQPILTITLPHGIACCIELLLSLTFALTPGIHLDTSLGRRCSMCSERCTFCGVSSAYQHLPSHCLQF